jgi:ABC-type glycerol-3-phosphate transport system permease component
MSPFSARDRPLDYAANRSVGTLPFATYLLCAATIFCFAVPFALFYWATITFRHNPDQGLIVALPSLILWLLAGASGTACTIVGLRAIHRGGPWKWLLAAILASAVPAMIVLGFFGFALLRWVHKP